MMRTSVYLPPALLERLRIASRQRRQPVSMVVRNLLDQSLTQDERARREQMYKELRKLDGACKVHVTDASTTIDEALYGENGAWRGRGK